MAMDTTKEAEAAEAAAEETKEAPTEEKPTGPSKIEDLFGKDEDEEDDTVLLAQLTDSVTGKLAGDFDLPDEYLLDTVSSQLLEHLTAYTQAKEVWRGSRNLADRKRSQDAFNMMKHHQLVAAILQKEYPGSKMRSDELAIARASANKRVREAALNGDKE